MVFLLLSSPPALEGRQRRKWSKIESLVQSEFRLKDVEGQQVEVVNTDCDTFENDN